MCHAVDQPGGVQGEAVAEQCCRVERRGGTLAPGEHRHHCGDQEAEEQHQREVKPEKNSKMERGWMTHGQFVSGDLLKKLSLSIFTVNWEEISAFLFGRD